MNININKNKYVFFVDKITSSVSICNRVNPVVPKFLKYWFIFTLCQYRYVKIYTKMQNI